MTPEEYYESQASLDAYEQLTEVWDNVYVPDETLQCTHDWYYINEEVMQCQYCGEQQR
jgi:hypothetical protein